jgi:hypothetical protein
LENDPIQKMAQEVAEELLKKFKEIITNGRFKEKGYGESEVES